MKRNSRYKSMYQDRKRAKKYRDFLRSIGECICGPGHGPATHGTRCHACRLVHRGAAANRIDAFNILSVTGG